MRMTILRPAALLNFVSFQTIRDMISLSWNDRGSHVDPTQTLRAAASVHHFTISRGALKFALRLMSNQRPVDPRAVATAATRWQSVCGHA